MWRRLRRRCEAELGVFESEVRVKIVESGSTNELDGRWRNKSGGICGGSRGFTLASDFVPDNVVNSGRQERVNILGVGVSVLTMDTALEKIETLLDRGERGYICVCGAQGIIEAQNDPQYRDILNSAFLNTPDGLPTVWLGKYHGFRNMGRVYGPRLMLALCERSVAKGSRHFLYGGRSGVVEKLKTELKGKYPGLEIVGTYTPPFRPLTQDEEQDLVRQVEGARPDIFWCGLGAPKQERFMAQYLDRLPVKLMIGVGAAFDILSGTTREAPEWVLNTGLTSIFRVWQEPRRLWRRYLFNNPRFVWLTFLQLSGLRRYTL
jgi:N-acetylglucosaminyldiphosphoundecaprenol N-acetyl-beta-D-mannosaminyltransferase